MFVWCYVTDNEIRQENAQIGTEEAKIQVFEDGVVHVRKS